MLDDELIRICGSIAKLDHPAARGLCSHRNPSRHPVRQRENDLPEARDRPPRHPAHRHLPRCRACLPLRWKAGRCRRHCKHPHTKPPWLRLQRMPRLSACRCSYPFSLRDGADPPRCTSPHRPAWLHIRSEGRWDACSRQIRPTSCGTFRSYPGNRAVGCDSTLPKSGNGRTPTHRSEGIPARGG